MEALYSRPGLDLKIGDSESLGEAYCYVHDALFSTDDVVHDEERRAFRVLLWRELPALAHCRRILPFVYGFRSPRAGCVLEFRGVEEASVRVTDPWGIDWYSLNEIRYDARKRLVRFHRIMGPLEIELTVERLDAELKDTGDIARDKFRDETIVFSLKKGVQPPSAPTT